MTGDKRPKITVVTPAPPPVAPALTEDEKKLLATQTGLAQLQSDLLKKQVANQERLNALVEQALTAPLTEREKLEEDLLQETTARALKAVRGELPVSSALERDLEIKGQELEETYFRMLGPGYKQSSPYIAAKALFEKDAAVLRDTSRRGELSELGQLSLARGTQATQRKELDLNALLQLGQAGFAGVAPMSGGITALSDLARVLQYNRMAPYLTAMPLMQQQFFAQPRTNALSQILSSGARLGGNLIAALA